MNVVLSNDASWGGWGWSICTEVGPHLVGWTKLGGGWDWWKLRQFLEGDLETILIEARTLRTPESPPVLVIAEKAPTVYSRGNQASTGYGIGRIVGPICVWATRPEHGDLSYPYTPTPKEWRELWPDVKWPRKRAAVKLAAIRLCHDQGWGGFINGFEDRGPKHDHAPRADVAESIAMGVGVARHRELWPRGPVRGIDLAPISLSR